MPWVSVCERTELVRNEGKYVEIDGFKLGIFWDGQGIHAIDDQCPHAKGSLGNGWIDRGCAVCPLHAWAFDLNTGEMRGAPGVKVRVYPVKEKPMPDGRVLIMVDLPGY